MGWKRDTYIVRQDVPAPTPVTGGLSYMLRRLKVGESFDLECDGVSGFHSFAKRTAGIRVTTKRISDGVYRIWRIEDTMHKSTHYGKDSIEEDEKGNVFITLDGIMSLKMSSSDLQRLIDLLYERALSMLGSKNERR
jgi:hypothetical protein